MLRIDNVLKMLIGAGLGLSLSANVQSSETPGGYMGVKLGMSYYNEGCASDASSCDDNSPMGGLYAGYNFNDWLAIEGGYSDLGEVKVEYSGSDAVGTMKTVDLFLKGKLTLDQQLPLPGDKGQLSLFAKLGGVYWMGENDYTDASANVNDEGFDVALGGGIACELSDNWSAQLEYQLIPNLGNSDLGSSDQQAVSVGFSYSFNQ